MQGERWNVTGSTVAATLTDWKTDQKPVDESLLINTSSKKVGRHIPPLVSLRDSQPPTEWARCTSQKSQSNRLHKNHPAHFHQVGIPRLLWSVSWHLQVFSEEALYLSAAGGCCLYEAEAEIHTRQSDHRKIQQWRDRVSDQMNNNTGTSQTKLSQPDICRQWKKPSDPLDR